MVACRRPPQPSPPAGERYPRAPSWRCWSSRSPRCSWRCTGATTSSSTTSSTSSVIRGRESGVAWEWLGNDYFQHFAPGHRAVNSLQDDVAPLNYRVVLVAMVAAMALAAYALSRTLDLLFGARWLHPLLAFCFGISVLFVSPLQWWSAGLQIVPTTLAGVACLYGYARHRRDGGVRWLLLAVAATAAGLLFYVRPVLFVVYLLAVRVLVLSDGLRPRAVLAGLWRERLTWAALATPRSSTASTTSSSSASSPRAAR